MKPTATRAAAALIIIAFAATVHAERLQPRLRPVPDATVPSQPAASRQSVPQQERSEPAASAADTYSSNIAAPASVTPELLIGCWNLDIDSYIDARLQHEGKLCADPAKIECVRNVLKAKCVNVSFEFQPNGCASVSKSYCGKCEAKSGSWCAKCIDGPRMAVELRSKHGFSRKCLDVTVCDDLHIRVNAPHEVAGVYERVPYAVHDIKAETSQPTINATRRANVPSPSDEIAP